MTALISRVSMIGLLLAGMLLVACTQAVPVATAASFCSSRIVRDYEAPLRALPEANPIPGVLPFASPGLEASAFRWPGGNLLYRGGAVSLSLAVAEGQMQLNWTVKMAVSRTAADGSSSEPVLETTTRVESVQKGQAAPVIAGLLGEVGTFRVDTTFLDSAGAALGSYFEYIEVVPRTLQVRLALSQRAIRPGGKIRFRLENLGTLSVGYGLPYLLERYEEQHWEPVPQGPFFMPLYRLSAERAGRCQAIQISQPGLYRLSKDILLERGRKKVTKYLRRTFRVRSPR